MRFKTKAENLLDLSGKLQHAKILPIFVVKFDEWRSDSGLILKRLNTKEWAHDLMVVRSSSASEDQTSTSNAGKFHSDLNVCFKNIEKSIQKVFDSYGEGLKPEEQVLIQPMLKDVYMSGVLFTKDPSTAAPYYIINYETQGDTEAVTSGKKECILHTQIISKSILCTDNLNFAHLIQLARELEYLYQTDSLDIEFAITQTGQVYLFQVRPLVAEVKTLISSEQHTNILQQVSQKIEQQQKEHPYLYGKRTILGVMPDWNPAEIIGIRPKPLALSVYKEIITDTTWAYQRSNYGYKNLRGFPLLVDYCGLPYIDVRVSFNSFLPKDLDDDLSERLVNYYLDRLKENPELHDKVEFDIVYSCYTFDLEDRIQKLEKYGFRRDDITLLVNNLRNMTNDITHRESGLWVEDAEKISILEKRHQEIYFNKDLDTISKIYWLIEDCKRYGTLPFAGLARAGFIAVQILNSMVTVGALTLAQRHAFINSLEAVSSQMTRDMQLLDKQHFLQKYGHLRPGTYDILSPRYDEFSDTYFQWDKLHQDISETPHDFHLTLKQMQSIEKILVEHGLGNDVVGLFTFLKSAIEGREYAKFVFTRNLSDVLLLIQQLGEEKGFCLTDLAFLDISSILSLYGSSWDVEEVLSHSIDCGKKNYAITTQLNLPPLIFDPKDVFSFKWPENRPNFITLKQTTAPVVTALTDPQKMEGAIVMIPSADPGFDWIFTHHIAGFITAYGGVNSHMAIRAGELGLPAIIGAGEILYKKLSKAHKLFLDCSNQVVQVIA